MSWFRVFIIVATVLVASCTSDNVVSDAHKDALGKISISIPSSRIGQLYRQRLNRMFARNESSENLYELNVSITSSDSTDFLDMSATFTLYDKNEGKNVFSRKLSSSASIGAVASLYGAEEAKRHARERLAWQLAEKTYTSLILYFARTENQSS